VHLVVLTANDTIHLEDVILPVRNIFLLLLPTSGLLGIACCDLIEPERSISGANLPPLYGNGPYQKIDSVV
jgi:hypothetical protein